MAAQSDDAATGQAAELVDEQDEIDALGWIYAMARQDARAKRERDSSPPTHPIKSIRPDPNRGRRGTA